MHVVLLNQAFHPDVVATAQMGKDLADALVRRGHTVSAIASRSIYGKKGASLARREEIVVGPASNESDVKSPPPNPFPPGGGVIHVSRVGMSVFGKAGIAARIADFGLFYVLALWRLLTMERPDVVVCYTTPPFIGLAGIVCRWLRGSKSVYWVMDLYPDAPVACGVMKERGVATRFFERVNRFILERSDIDVVLGRCMEERVVAKGTPRERVKMIPVWADLGGIAPIEHAENPLRKLWAPRGEFLVMYSGNFGLGHDAKTIIGAMKLLRDESGIRFVFIGGGKRRKEVEAAVAEFGLTNAAIEDYRPREELSRSLSAGDVHLISLREGAEGVMVPSKMYGIMAVARPSLFVGHPSSEIARVLEESGSGFTVREGDSAALAAKIMELRSDGARRQVMGNNGRAAIVGRYDSATACARWVDMLEGLVRDKGEAKQ